MSERFIVPLPGLVTTDGQQQYLTNKGGTWFASRRAESLRQTWKWEHLDYIPEVYKKFAVDLMDYVPEMICWKSAMVLENFMKEKMEERNKIFAFSLRDGLVVKGSVLSTFQNVEDPEQIRVETMDSDFITIVNRHGEKVLLSKYQIIAVEEV